MKLKIKARYLIDAISLGHVKGRSDKNPDPDENVIIDASDDKLTVRRSYHRSFYEGSSSIGIGEFDIETPGRAAVPAADLLRVLKVRPSQTVTLEVKGDGELMFLEADMYSVNIKTTDEPEIVSHPEEKQRVARYDAKVLSGALARAVALVADNWSRPQMNHAHIEIHPDETTILVASDGFRMGIESIDWEPMGDWDETAVIDVPLDMARLFLKTIKPPAGRNYMCIAKDGAVLISDSLTEIAYRPVGMEHNPYPDWQNTVNTSVTQPRKDGDVCEAVIDFDDFEILSKVAHAAGANKGPVRFETVKDGLIAWCGDSADHKPISDHYAKGISGFTFELPAKIERHGNWHVALNRDYLVEAVKTMRASAKLDGTELDELTMNFVKPSDCVKLEFANLPDYMQVIMPMYVQWSSRDGQA